MPSFTPTLVVMRDFGDHKIGDTIVGHEAIVAVLGGPDADAVQMRRDLHDPETGKATGNLVGPINNPG